MSLLRRHERGIKRDQNKVELHSIQNSRTAVGEDAYALMLLAPRRISRSLRGTLPEDAKAAP